MGGHIKEGVVTKAVGALGLAHEVAAPDAVGGLGLAVGVHKGHHAVELGTELVVGGVGNSRQEFLVVGFVGGAFACVTGRINAGGTVEAIDFQT